MNKLKEYKIKNDFIKKEQSAVFVLLAQKEVEKLKPHQYELGAFVGDNIGFIDPDSIVKYEFKGQIYFGSPEIEIYIERESVKQGQFYSNVVYSHIGEIFFSSALYISDQSPIDKRFIREDKTGKFITPTPQIIEDLLDRATRQAEEGVGFHNEVVERAIMFSDMIKYSISQERIDTIHQIARKTYINHMQNNLSDIVERISGRSYAFSLHQFDDNTSSWEGTGLSEEFGEFAKVLPSLNIPDDPTIRQNILQIFSLYRGMIKDEYDRISNETRELLERRRSIKDELKCAKDNLEKIAQRMNLSIEE